MFKVIVTSALNIIVVISVHGLRRAMVMCNNNNCNWCSGVGSEFYGILNHSLKTVMHKVR